jgi:hypothetical protein
MIRDRGLARWLPTYIAEAPERFRLRRLRRKQLTHLFFLVCDHFEPRHGIRDPEQPRRRLRAWHAGYRELQDDCAKRYGLRPVHSWFYPPHHGSEQLPTLAEMAFDRLGEVELHFHHAGDTKETLRRSLTEALAQFASHGLLLQTGNPPGARFGFIHGDWALDNSAGGAFCGVNGELLLLEDLGCWADLTMPSGNRCQTRRINSIYYAGGDPTRPRSHDWGPRARVEAGKLPGIMLIQGPLGVNWTAPGHPRIENASLTAKNWGRPDRVQSWLNCHVHVEGRPEWLFIKLHTHGAVERDFDALFGEQARAMHRCLGEKFNDGRAYRLHYVTARQAFNVIRAAERGFGGDPTAYFDLEVPPPVTQLYCLDAPHELACATSERVALTLGSNSGAARLVFRAGGKLELSGDLRSVEYRRTAGRIDVALTGADTELAIRPGVGCAPIQITGGSVARTDSDGTLRVRASARVTIELGSQAASRGPESSA